MKYYLFLAAFFLFGCQSKTDSNKPKTLAQKVTTIIQGTIASPNYPNVTMESLGEQYTAQLNQQGQFALTVLLDEPRIFNIQYGRRAGQVFINPGDTLRFSTTARQFSQVMNFTGDRAVENNYLTEKFNKDRVAKSMKVNTYKLEEPEFIAAVEANKMKSIEAFKAFAASNTIDPFFKFLIETEINYEWATDRLIYPKYHEFYAQKENFAPSPVYFDFYRDLDKDDSGKMISANFNAFISNYTDLEAQKILKRDASLKLLDNGLAKTKFKVVEDNFANAEIKEFLMYTTLKTHIQYEGANGTPELLKTFNDACANQYYKNSINNDYSVWRGLEAGNVAPMFAYNDINGNLHDMANYKGKYIYVDVWATWCGPCKKELPYLEALQEEYKDNDKILFTSVSIDRDKSSWERMVNDKNMQGLQLFAENEWRASIIKDYKINGIPRFLLIDDQGKIVSANAPRPSSDRIKAKLSSLVK